MKKLYVAPKSVSASRRFSLVQVVSLGTAAAALLSSVSPVFSANLAITAAIVRSTNAPGVDYPRGSQGSIVLAGDNDSCGVDQVEGRINGGGVTTISAKEQYERFVENKVFGDNKTPYGTTTTQVTKNDASYMGTLTGGIEDSMPSAYGIYSFATGCGSYAAGNYSTAFGAGATTNGGGAQAFGVSALATGATSVALGVGAEASGLSSLSIGGLAKATAKNSVAIGVESSATADYAVAIGKSTVSKADGSIAIGSATPLQPEIDEGITTGAQAETANAIAIGARSHVGPDATDSIAIGRSVYVSTEESVAIGGQSFIIDDAAGGTAIGAGAFVLTNGGIALGRTSKAETAAFVPGYDPEANAASQDTNLAWRSTFGALSIGNTKSKITRQITGVAAGTGDTDAVNVAQLKALRALASKGWTLSVDDVDGTTVGLGGSVDFSAKINNDNLTGTNLEITKSVDNNAGKTNITIGLADSIVVNRVATGKSSLSDDGLVITGGPSVISDGIDAGNKKITGVADGVDGNDAVNYSQLKTLKDQVDEGWNISAGGADGGPVTSGSTVDFSGKDRGDTTGRNIEVTKTTVGDTTTMTFDLAEYIKVGRVETGLSSMSNAGFMITGGPNMTEGGIFAGNKKITGVADGVNDNDAVNFAQLNELKQQVSGGWSLYVNDDSETIIGPERSLMLVATPSKDGNKNLKITQTVLAADNKDYASVAFDLADDITVSSVTTGSSNLSNNGLVITGGPSVVSGGIDAGNKKITSVEKGDKDSDAVNFAQLQELREMIVQGEGWKLSVDGKSPSLIDPGSTVDFSIDSANPDKKNLRIEKTLENDVTKIAISLDRNIAIDTVLTGNSRLSSDGLTITDGPRMIAAGIDAGDKKITGVAKGTDNNDAVNFLQFSEVSERISQYLGGSANVLTGAAPVYYIKGAEYHDVATAFAAVNSELSDIVNDSLIKYNEEEELITIGKEVPGTKIDIINKDGAKRVISGIANGQVAENSTEAVNGAQLYGIDQKVTELGEATKYINKLLDTTRDKLAQAAQSMTNYLGGGTDMFNDVAPTYTVQGNKYNNVGDSFSSVDASLTDIYSKIADVSGNGIVQQDTGTNVITIGKNVSGTKIDITSKDSAERTISGVAEGTISATSTEAITGKQLQSMGTQIAAYLGGGAAYNNGQWTNPKFVVTTPDVNGSPTDATYDNVANAFGGVNNSLKNINSRLDDGLSWNKDKKAYDAGRGGQANKITGVADGVNNDDAVNFAQLNELKAQVDGGWNISASGADSGPIAPGGTVNFSGKDRGDATGSNIQVTKTTVGDTTTMTFDLAEYIKVGRVETGLSSMSNAGFMITGGPNMTEGGIFAGNKKITGVADGVNGNDAVNFAQLSGISSNISKYFGGGANVFTGVAPLYTIQGEGYDNVGEAFDSVDASLTDIYNKIADVSDNSLVQQDAGANVITIGKNVSGTKIDITNKNGAERTISGVADGEISATSTEAITGKQLQSMGSQIATYLGGGAAYNNGQWTDPEFVVTTLSANGSAADATYYSVAGAFSGVNHSLKNMNNRLNEIENKANDGLSWDEDAKVYDAGRGGQANKIINVADGRVAEGSKEAVNGGQLSEVDKKISKLKDQVDNIEIGDGINLGGIVKYEKDQDGNKKVVLEGAKEGEPVLIDNVKDGEIEVGSRQAVNGGQLKQQMGIVFDNTKQYTDQAISSAITQAKSYTDMKFNALNYGLEETRKEARQAAAVGLAVANLRYNDVPGKLSVAFGGGLWHGQSAFAFGAGYTSEDGKFHSNVSATSAGGQWGVGGGISITLN